MKTVIIVIVLVVILAGGYFLFQSQQTQSNPSANQTENSTQAVPSNEAMEQTSGAVKEFTVTGKPFSFTPNTMTVNKGDTVKITFKNAEGMHDFVIDEFGVSTKQLQAGQEETITFVADKTGSFEYYCSVGNHRAMGMKGTLTVQ